MPTFISLLRGVNVGTCRIKMAPLKALYERLGYTDVQTYLQSGNLVFQAAGRASEHAAQLRQAIKAEFSYDLPILVLTAAELASILKKNPFLKKPGIDESFLHVTLLAEPAAQKLPLDKLPKTGDEEATIIGESIYLYCPHGYGRTKLNNTYFERLAKVPATTRNWRTMQALAKVAG